MKNYPDFSNYGYQINRELGHNRAGGRVTYLATEINTQKPVVIKQFQFATRGAVWSEYQAYEQEINLLKRLNFPNIPRYLDSFQTGAGFCMVQEYKKAPSLATKKELHPQQIKQIAISVLEILKYLQKQIPPIIHRDLKPENILVDRQMNVTLVDFGFARIGGGEVAVSSVVKGTLGFMPPEQMFNRELTFASDLYSLGATLICLLTNTNSLEVGKLIDETGSLKFRSKLPHLSEEFLNWLEKMVAPRYQDRFSSAEVALDALIPINILPITEANKLLQNSWLRAGVMAGVMAGVVALLVPLTMQLFFRKPNFQTELIVATDVTTLANVDTVKMNQGMVYFLVKLSEIPENNQNYRGTCQLFDGVGALVAVGQSTLKNTSGKIEAWCGYDFSKSSDRSGIWRFKFFVNDKQILERELTVSSSL
ncbi:MAG: serine/threonine-protein kinase [Microcoleaceae cyanobacterium MO_207.B10]|nr:serine/threonine-protein kinase [Microcoleaceae cyanobacterium MO_207.B10]